MFADPRDFPVNGIGIGDEVFMTGVFASASGKRRNTPIVRKGNIAMLPDDNIPTRDLGDIDAFLIEAHSFGGISGAPVFVRETTFTKYNLSPLKPGDAPETIVSLSAGRHSLLGLVHGHWDIDDQDLNAVYAKPPKDEGHVNLGISIIVPAAKILETLQHPQLVEHRMSQEGEILAGRLLPTPDHGSGQ
jgi:hypothetical protein